MIFCVLCPIFLSEFFCLSLRCICKLNSNKQTNPYHYKLVAKKTNFSFIIPPSPAKILPRRDVTVQLLQVGVRSISQKIHSTDTFMTTLSKIELFNYNFVDNTSSRKWLHRRKRHRNADS